MRASTVSTAPQPGGFRSYADTVFSRVMARGGAGRPGSQRRRHAGLSLTGSRRTQHRQASTPATSSAVRPATGWIVPRRLVSTSIPLAAAVAPKNRSSPVARLAPGVLAECGRPFADRRTTCGSATHGNRRPTVAAAALQLGHRSGVRRSRYVAGRVPTRRDTMTAQGRIGRRIPGWKPVRRVVRVRRAARAERHCLGVQMAPSVCDCRRTPPV
jgi:hypothetical protein